MTKKIKKYLVEFFRAVFWLELVLLTFLFFGCRVYDMMRASNGKEPFGNGFFWEMFIYCGTILVLLLTIVYKLGYKDEEKK
ncbi:MAG: hypothetical protein PHY40_00145 [Patescibacteria group bacterium]|nr:hypothetical protein [Patescibacteria group bacterium]